MKTLLLSLLISFSLSAAPVYQESFVAPLGFKPANHGSSILELSSGSLLDCWYAGERESGPDVQVFCANSLDQGRTWDTPRAVVKVGEWAEGAAFKNKTVGNVALYEDDSHTLWLFYSAVMIGGWSGSHVDYKTSKDLGKSWSTSKRLIGAFGNLPRNKPVRLGVNQFFLPLYHELFSFQGYGCDIHVSEEKVTSNECFDIPGSDHGQPAVVLRNNKIFAYLRTKKTRAVLFSSFDRALKQWSNPVPLDLPNPDAAVDAEVDSLGNILLVYNDSIKGRAPLSLGTSQDGIHFKKLWDFEKDPKGNFSYPALRRGSNGQYYLSYTYQGRSAIKVIHFNDEWLSHTALR